MKYIKYFEEAKYSYKGNGKINENAQGVKYMSREEFEEIRKESELIMKRIVTMVYSKHPFFGSLLSRLKVRSANPAQIPTMATDGKSIMYSPIFVMQHKDNYQGLIWVVCHEILHCALGHFARMGNREPRKWNFATDYAINLLLDSVGDPLEGALYDKKWEGMASEVIYDQLPTQDQDDQGDGQGQGEGQGDGDGQGDGQEGDGQEGDGDDQGQGDPSSGGQPGQGGQPSPGGGGDGDQVPYLDPNSASSPGEVRETGSLTEDDGDGEGGEGGDELQKQWNDAMINAASKHPGSTPGGIKESIKKQQKPKVNWKKKLKKYMADISRKMSYKLPNRRLVGYDQYVWGLKRKEGAIGNMVIAIDTSGSMGTNILEQILSEMDGIVKDFDIKDLTIIQYDTQVQKVEKVSNPSKFDSLEVEGRGGTDITDALEYIEKNVTKKREMVVVWFSDMDMQHMSWPSPPRWAQRSIFCIFQGDPNYKVPWGKHINVDME